MVNSLRILQPCKARQLCKAGLFQRLGWAPSCLSILLSSAACGRPHVSLEAPPATAPASERITAYEKLQPAFQREREIIPESGPIQKTVDFVELEDGRRIYHPTDLLPVISKQSAAYDAVQRYRRQRRTAHWLFIAGGVTIVAGGAAIASSAGANTNNIDEVLAIGGGLAIGGALIFPIGNGFGRAANRNAMKAFRYYEEGLRQRLEICRQDGRPVDC